MGYLSAMAAMGATDGKALPGSKTKRQAYHYQEYKVDVQACKPDESGLLPKPVKRGDR